MMDHTCTCPIFTGYTPAVPYFLQSKTIYNVLCRSAKNRSRIHLSSEDISSYREQPIDLSVQLWIIFIIVSIITVSRSFVSIYDFILLAIQHCFQLGLRLSIWMYDVGYRSLSEGICSIPWYSTDSLADWSRRVIILLQESSLLRVFVTSTKQTSFRWTNDQSSEHLQATSGNHWASCSFHYSHGYRWPTTARAATKASPIYRNQRLECSLFWSVILPPNRSGIGPDSFI